MSDNHEEPVTTLVFPNEYVRHINQVAGVTTKNISFLKRKLVSTSGGEIVEYPLSDCTGIVYKDERPILMIVMGILLILLVCSIFYMLAVNWDRLESGTQIRVGLLVLAIAYGVRWTFGSRRHKLVFILNDGTELIWKSRSGDYKLKRGSSQTVIEFARSVGLLKESK